MQKPHLGPNASVGVRVGINLVVCAAAIWGFSGLLEEVLEKEALVRWDVSVNRWFAMHATPLGIRAFEVLTTLGSELAYAFAALGLVWLWRRREPVLAWALVAVVGGGYALERVLKITIHRTRPAFSAASEHHGPYSFPSGHAMMATLCYTMLAFVVGETLRWPAARRALAYAGALAIVILVSISRLYLGAHFPSDVIGGAIAGIGWVTLCLTAMHLVRHHRGTRTRNAARKAA